MQPQSLNPSKKIIWLTLMSLMMVIVSACGGGQSQTEQKVGKASDDKQIYVWPIEGRNDLQAFDPALVTDLPSISAVNLVFTGLVQLDDKLQVRDQLAQSHQVAADGVTWTFKLKSGLKFSDGQPLTSADVAYSIDRALKPELKSTTSPLYLGLIKDADKRQAGKIPSLINRSILTPDPQTVVLIANQKAAYFLQILTYQSSFVVEKSMIDKYGDNFVDHLSEGIGGAGPFKVSKYIRGKQIEFVPNENYYGSKPQLKKIVMPFYQREDTSYRAYQADQIHMASVQAAQVEQAKALPNEQLHQVPLLDVYYFALNYLAKPFDNIKIRQAFALALDKDAIAQNIYKGSVNPTNHIIPEGMQGYNPNLKGPGGTTDTKGDQQTAKQLLVDGMKEAGYSLKTLPSVTLTYSSQGSSDLRNELSAVQQMWQSVLGISVKLDDIDFNKLLEERHNSLNNPNGLQMFALYWVSDYPDPQDWLTLIFDKGSSKNAMNYGQNNTPRSAAQQAVQKLMEEADITQDQNKRLQMYNQAEQQLVNDVAWIPRYQYKATFVRKSCVVGVVDNPQQTYAPDMWGNVYISTVTPCANVQQYS